MCGRYQFTEPQNADLRRILQDVRRRCGDRAQDFRFGDVMPTAAAPVLIANGGKVVADLQTWGIPGWKGGLMINARAETVCEKPMFRRSMAAQRCVIPATSFYEWDAARDQIRPWLTDAESALHLLAAPPPLLERHSTDGQMSFGDLL